MRTGSASLAFVQTNMFSRTPNGYQLDDRNILKQIKPLAERLGLDHSGFGWRTFRRMNITGMQEGDDAINVFEAMAQAGHNRPETTMRYMLLGSGSPRDRKVRELQE